MKGHEGVDEGGTVGDVVPVLVDEFAHEFRAIGEHGLPYAVRADGISLAPVDGRVVIILCLVGIIVERKVLDAVCTVCTPFPLCRCPEAGENQHCGH